MISKTILEELILWQLGSSNKATYQRDALSKIAFTAINFAHIISGIRRCGKSTLVQQIMEQYTDRSLYLNFDTPNLFGFQMNDFRVLDAIIAERNPTWLFFDEIQVVTGWEVYVRSKLEQGYHVIVTGSNSSMLSRELGTRLTGRHLSYTLFPFSYQEYLGFTNQMSNAGSLNEYLSHGGFPEYIQTKEPRILIDLINDILYRDILVRYNIRDEIALKSLFVYLMGNIANRVSANKLTSVIGVKSPVTVSDYFSYLENRYLVKFLPKFSYSYKTQVMNPKKVYSIDLGLHRVSTPSFSQDRGRKLENEVFLELMRMGYDLFYYNENQHECDFVLCQNNSPIEVIQVCDTLSHENEEREIRGLVEAMAYFHKEKGTILTFDQEDLMFEGDKEIQVIPIWKWLKANRQ